MTPPKAISESHSGPDPPTTEQTEPKFPSAAISKIGSSTNPNDATKSCHRGNLASEKSKAVNSNFNTLIGNGLASNNWENRTEVPPPNHTEAAKAYICKKAVMLAKDDQTANKLCLIKEGPVTTFPGPSTISLAPPKKHPSSSAASTAVPIKKTSKFKQPKQNTNAKFSRDRGKQQVTRTASNADRRSAARREVRRFVKILPATKNNWPLPPISLQDFGDQVTNVKNKNVMSHSEAPVASSLVGNSLVQNLPTGGFMTSHAPISTHLMSNSGSVTSNLVGNSLMQNRPVTGFMTSHDPAATGSPFREATKSIPTNRVANDSKWVASNSFTQGTQTANQVNPNNPTVSRNPVVVGLPNIPTNPATGRARDGESPPTTGAEFMTATDHNTTTRFGKEKSSTVKNRLTISHEAQCTISFAPQDSSENPTARVMRERSHNNVFVQGPVQVPGDNSKHVPPSDSTEKCITSALVKQLDDSHKAVSMHMYMQRKPAAPLMNVSQPPTGSTLDTPSTLIDKTNFQGVPQASLQSACLYPSSCASKAIDAKEIMPTSKDEPDNLPKNSSNNAGQPPSTQHREKCQLDSISDGAPSHPAPMNRDLPQDPRTALTIAEAKESASRCPKSTESKLIAGTVEKGTEGSPSAAVQGPSPSESQRTPNIGPSTEGEDNEIQPNVQDPEVDDFIEVELPYGSVTTFRMTKEDLYRHIPVWNSRLHYKLAGTSAPLGKNLVAYLQKKMGEYELYHEQDKGEQMRENNRGARATIWNKAELRKISGTSAPLKKNIEKYLKDHPDCEVYEDQAERLHPSVRSRLQNQNRVTLWNKVSRCRTGFGCAGPLRKNLQRYLEHHPHLEEYTGQDKILEAAKAKAEAQTEADPEAEAAEADGAENEQKSLSPDGGRVEQTGLNEDHEQWHPESPFGKRRCGYSVEEEKTEDNHDISPDCSLPIRSPKRHCPIDLSFVPDLNQFPLLPTDRAACPREWYENFYRSTERSEEDIRMAPHAVLRQDGQNSLVYPNGTHHTPETDIEDFFPQQLTHRFPQPQPDDDPFHNLEEEAPKSSDGSLENEGKAFNPDDFLNFDADVEADFHEEADEDQGNER